MVLFFYDNIVLEALDGKSKGKATISGRLFSSILSKADVAKRHSSQLSHYLNGAYFKVLTQGWASRKIYGPSGKYGIDVDWPKGEMQYCVPSKGWFMLVGEPLEGRIRFFTALQELKKMKDGSGYKISLYNNTHTNADTFVTTKARWFGKDFIETLYRKSSVIRDPQKATILGSAMKITYKGGKKERVYLKNFRVELKKDGASPIIGQYLSSDLKATQKGAYSNFVFFNIPPSSTDKPYTLSLFDEKGQKIKEYTQQIAPIAGGVMIPHN